MDRYLIIIVVVFLFLIGGGAYGLYTMKSEGSSCIKSPLIYGAQVYSKQASSDLICTCHFLDYKYNGFTFSKDGPINLESIKQEYKAPNLSSLNVSFRK